MITKSSAATECDDVDEFDGDGELVPPVVSCFVVVVRLLCVEEQGCEGRKGGRGERNGSKGANNKKFIKIINMGKFFVWFDCLKIYICVYHKKNLLVKCVCVCLCVCVYIRKNSKRMYI